MGIKVIEESFVSPPPGSVPTTCLPLTFIDVASLGFSGRQRLIFYEFPHPTLYFVQTTLPNLKSSLSRALQHFFPLAAKVLVPPHPPHQSPCFLYSEGDSVQFIACESTGEDFNHLTSNHEARRVQELKALVPDLPRPVIKSSSGCIERPVMAIQVTLFPMVGISIGIGFCHSVADGRSLAHFLKSWSSLHRCTTTTSSSSDCDQGDLPNFDCRDLVKDPLGLASIFLEEKRKLMEISISTTSTPNPIEDMTKLQASFVINRSQVESLKEWLAKKWINEEKQYSESEPLRISTFVATCAYMWVCLVKSFVAAGRDEGDDELGYFHFIADCRERLKLPTTYFGNCVDLCLTSAKRSELVGENGVAVAAKAIAREIRDLEQGLFKEADKWSSRLGAIRKAGGQIVAIFASPKFGMYKIDFGWGRPRKLDTANVGCSSGFVHSVSIYENGSEDEGGVEFGLGFDANHDINGFIAIFNHGLLNLIK